MLKCVREKRNFIIAKLLRLCLETVRDGDTVKHYRVRQLDEGGFFIARRVTFRTLTDLVEHYARDPDGLCVNLKKPCPQVRFFCQKMFIMWRRFQNCCSSVSKMTTP